MQRMGAAEARHRPCIGPSHERFKFLLSAMPEYDVHVSMNFKPYTSSRLQDGKHPDA